MPDLRGRQPAEEGLFSGDLELQAVRWARHFQPPNAECRSGGPARGPPEPQTGQPRGYRPVRVRDQRQQGLQPFHALTVE